MGKGDRKTHKKRKKSSTREASATEAAADGICSDSEPQADPSNDGAALQAELKRHKQVSKAVVVMCLTAAQINIAHTRCLQAGPTCYVCLD